MAFSKEDAERFENNALLPEDTFRFDCDQCAKCCRKRRSPVLITGADAFRIACGTHQPIKLALYKHTSWYIGDQSHIPVVYLEERFDGSCSFLRQGRCEIQDFKPAVCALYPLGRMFDYQKNQFCYFHSGDQCGIPPDKAKEWTLNQWLDASHIRDQEQDAFAWSQFLVGVVPFTAKLNREELDNDLVLKLLDVLYLDYDIDKPYRDQVLENEEAISQYVYDHYHERLMFKEP